MIYNLSTILFNAMKNPNQKPLTIFQNNPYKKFQPKKITIDIELANIKSMEIYNKFNTKSKFSILDKNQDIIKTNVKKYKLCLIGCFYIFLASFRYLPSLSYFLINVI